MYDRLVNYIPKPIRKVVGGIKDKVVSIFKTNTLKDYGKQTMYGRSKKVRKLKTQKQSEDNKIKLEKEKEAKDTIIRDITTFWQGDYSYKAIRVGKTWNNSYIKYESNGHRNKNLSVKEYLGKIKLYLMDITIDIQKSGTWKIQLTMAINFISSKDVDEERVIHSKSNNT